MKKLILIPLILFAFLTVNAKGISDMDYVVTKNATYFCQDITIGLLNYKCTLEDGEVLSLKLNEIRAYKKDGRIFERLPIYQENQATGSTSFMELLGMKDELKLFKYVNYVNTATQNLPIDEYFVYRNGVYVLELTPKSGPNVLKFFGR